MTNRVLLATSGLALIFVAAASIMMGFSVIVGQIRDEPNPVDGMEAARHLMYKRFPLEAGIANAIMMFITFLLVLPGLLTPTRGLLKVGSGAIVVCAIFTLCIGIFLWVLTLNTKGTFFPTWKQQSQEIQALMENSFACCGYFNSTTPAFVTTSEVCPSPAAAALMRGCAGPVASFTNELLDDIFTAVFGVVGIDALLVVSIACLLKDRKERERYRHIDEKSGFRTF
jgi:hypothetical protein